MPEGERTGPVDVGEPGKRVELDGHLREELAVCEKYQISYSHFLGGPQAWTDRDRALAQAYRAWSAKCCRTCGTHPDWWDPAKGGHRHQMVAEDHRCPGCENLEELREQIPPKARGVSVHLIPNPELHPDPEADHDQQDD